MASTIAVMASLMMAFVLGASQPWWAGISALVVIQPSVGATRLKALMRIVGTFFGAGIGAVLLAWDTAHTPMILPIIFLFTCWMVISLHSGKYPYAHGMAAGTAIIVLLTGWQSPQAALNIALARAWEVALGVSVGWVMADLLLPVSAGREILDIAESVRIKLAPFFGEFIDSFQHQKFDLKGIQKSVRSIEKDIRKGRGLIPYTRLEKLGGRKPFSLPLMLSERLMAAIETVQDSAFSFQNTDFQGYPHLFETELESFKNAWERFMDPAGGATPGGDPKASSGVSTAELGQALQALYARHQSIRESGDNQGFPVEASFGFHFFLSILSQWVNACQQAPDPEPVSLKTHEDSSNKWIRSGDRLRSLEPAVLKQAIKVGLAMMVLPSIWLAFGWPGLSQTAISIMAVFHPDVLTTRHRGFLRLMGCLTGVCLGLVVYLIWVPNLGFWLCALTIGLLPMNYVGAGPTSNASFGFQVAVAYIIALSHSNPAAISIEPILIRLAAITAGVTFIVVINRIIWPQSPLAVFRQGIATCRETSRAALAGLFKRFLGQQAEVSEPLTALETAWQKAATQLEANADPLTFFEYETLRAMGDTYLSLHHMMVRLDQALTPEVIQLMVKVPDLELPGLFQQAAQGLGDDSDPEPDSEKDFDVRLDQARDVLIRDMKRLRKSGRRFGAPTPGQAAGVATVYLLGDIIFRDLAAWRRLDLQTRIALGE